MSKKKIERIKEIETTLWDNLEKCELCPRKCGVDRYRTTGICGLPARAKISNAVLHFGEEPPISGKRVRVRCSSAVVT